MKKGYWFLLLFSLIISILKNLERVIVESGYENIFVSKIVILRIVLLFVIIYVPGFFVIRWYYKLGK